MKIDEPDCTVQPKPIIKQNAFNKSIISECIISCTVRVALSYVSHVLYGTVEEYYC